MKSESVKRLIDCYLREKQSPSLLEEYQYPARLPTNRQHDFDDDDSDEYSFFQPSLSGNNPRPFMNQSVWVDHQPSYHVPGRPKAEGLVELIAEGFEVPGRPKAQGLVELIAEGFEDPFIPQRPFEPQRPLEPEEEAIARGIGRQLSELSDEFETDHKEATGNQASAFGSEMVQFKHRCIPVAPGCGFIEIPVVRMGNSEGTANVAWRTSDKTAIAGTHYSSNRGDISFAEGDQEKTIKIEILRNQGNNDVCFVVELFNPEGTEVGSVNPLTVYITDHTNLYDDEKQVVENIFNCGPNKSISNIASCLRDKVTMNTFKAGLQCACSNANSIPGELALGFELLSLFSHSGHFHQLKNVVCHFFSPLPELKDIVRYFD